MKPSVSVIVPVFNTERFLKRCIESILKQNLEELELILVDDGSMDSSGKICEEYKKKDRRVKVIYQENGGTSKARNTGLSVAQGKCVAFVDSDDYLPDDPNIYRNAFSILEHNEVDMVAWLWQFQNEKGNLVVDPNKVPAFFCGKLSTQEFAKAFYYGSYENGLVVGVWNKLFKRDYIKNVQFEGRLYEDEDWMSRVLAKPGNVFCEREVWYIYVQNNTSLTHQNFQKQNLVMLDIVKNRARLFEKDDFIRIESSRLFINLYIEYWYCAKKSDILPYDDWQMYMHFLRELISERKICFKDFVRYSVFYISPKLYELLSSKMRKRKL